MLKVCHDTLFYSISIFSEKNAYIFVIDVIFTVFMAAPGEVMMCNDAVLLYILLFLVAETCLAISSTSVISNLYIKDIFCYS